MDILALRCGGALPIVLVTVCRLWQAVFLSIESWFFWGIYFTHLCGIGTACCNVLGDIAYSVAMKRTVKLDKVPAAETGKTVQAE